MANIEAQATRRVIRQLRGSAPHVQHSTGVDDQPSRLEHVCLRSHDFNEVSVEKLGGQSVSNKLLWQPSDCTTICYD